MSPERWQRVESVFQSAIDLQGTEREAFLESSCGTDAELRREIDKLIASSDAAADFIESPVWTDSVFLNTSAKRKLSDSLEEDVERNGGETMLGKQVGVYRLVRELGRGGMGAVYLGERSDGEFRQNVAIKLIKRGMDSDFIVQRFRHERQILASFEHPFIARLLDGGSTEDSVPYFVMEFVEGDTFYNYCDAKRLPIRDRLKLFQKVCSAIGYAHERHVVHRDIKPSNILINSSGSPKLLDFGIAKILDPNLIHESLNPTASMLRMMTPDYASPEQVRGIEVTTASDIYSLGVLLYELLSGHKPYSFAGRALHEVTQVICEMVPERPSVVIERGDNLLPQYGGNGSRSYTARSATRLELQGLLAGDLDNIVMKAISKDPDDRYRSAQDLSRDITRHMSGARVEAPKAITGQHQRTEVLLRVPQHARALAVLPFKFLNLGDGDDTDDRFLGLGLADALITRLSKVRRFAVRPTSSILPFGDRPVDPIRAGRELNVDFILDGSIKRAHDRLRVTVQLLNVAENAAIWATSIDETLSDVLTLEDTLATKVIEVLLPQLTGSELQEFAKRGTQNPEAFEHYLRGRYYFNTFTEEGLAKSFVNFHSAIAADPDYGHAHAGIADYYNWLGMMGVLPPQQCFQPAIEAASRAIELDPELSEGHASLGFSLHAGNHDWAGAEKHLKRAIELNPSNANAYVWYAIVLYTEGRFEEGLEIAQRSVDLDPLTPFNHHNVAWGLYYARRFQEAEERYRRVISDFPSYSFGYYGLSKIHRFVGKTAEAIVENDRALELMDKSVFSLLSEAECYAANGDTNIAKEKIDALVGISQDRYVSPYQLALAYCYLNERELALAALELAHEKKEAWLNWMGVEPAFDRLRNDPRFQAILEKIGYRMFFNSFATGAANSRTYSSTAAHLSARPLPELTTLKITAGDQTDDGSITGTYHRKARKLPLIAGAVLLLLVIATGSYLAFFRGAERSAIAVRPMPVQNATILVLPFGSEYTDNPNLGAGLADALTNKLGNIKSLQVVSANTGRVIAGPDELRAATELGVSYLVRGRMTHGVEKSLLNAELIKPATGESLWAETFAAGDGDLFRIQTQLAERILTSLNIEPLPLERQQLLKSYTHNTEAYELYLLGRYLMADRSRENLRKAIEIFSRSVEADRGFALAYVGLADGYALLNLYDIDPPPDAYELARVNASHALSIDDNLAEAHASLAYVKFYHERDRSGSELEFRRAIQQNPSYAQAHHWFGLVLSSMNRPVEAISEAQVAQRLDPRSPSIKAATAIVYYMDRRYEEAIAECEKALAIDEKFIPALKVKRWVYTASGNTELALANFQKEMKYSGGDLYDAGWKIIRLQIQPADGDKALAIAELDRAAASRPIMQNPFSFAHETALAYAALGMTSKALDWLEKAEAAGSHSTNVIEVEPRLAGLRSEPRFIKILGKLRP